MTPRKYKVWWPDQGQTKDDARVFEGFDHEHAASEWAEWYDHHSADYLIVGGTAAEVQVRQLVRDTFERIVIYHRGVHPDADGAHIDLVILAIGGGSRMLRIARQTGVWVAQENFS